MANSHEPSYYEIALTNRQVVVAFVILLICLLCAFFSGVYIGREGTLRDQEQLVRTTPPAQAPANDEGRELDEFQFFDSDSGRTSPPDQQARLEPAPEPPSNPSADTTLLEDFGGEDAEPLPEEDAEEEPAIEAETPSERRARERRERQAREAAAAAQAPPTPAPAPRPREPERRAAAEPAAAPAASRAGKVVIQVFSSAEKDQAERIRQRLVNGGHPAFLSPVEVGGNTMYRVRIGPYATRGDAQKVADTVRKGYKLDTWITE